jgi:nucleotide-binding universal stress UspA family protein
MPLGLLSWGTDGPPVILVGVDGSRSSMRAGAYAAGLARRQGSQFVVLFVAHGAAAAGVFVEAGAALVDAQRQIGDELRRQAREGGEYHGLTVQFVTALGDPFAELVRVADQVRAEVVVVGASESAGHRVIGSIAVRLVRSARWPVIVVP